MGILEAIKLLFKKESKEYDPTTHKSCADCNGSGLDVVGSCLVCDGSGIVKMTFKEKFKLD